MGSRSLKNVFHGLPWRRPEVFFPGPQTAFCWYFYSPFLSREALSWLKCYKFEASALCPYEGVIPCLTSRRVNDVSLKAIVTGPWLHLAMGNKVAKESLNKNSGGAYQWVLSYRLLFPYKNLRLQTFHIRTLKVHRQESFWNSEWAIQKLLTGLHNLNHFRLTFPFALWLRKLKDN